VCRSWWQVALPSPGPATSAVEDLVEPGRGQRLPATRALQHHEHLLGGRVGRPFAVEVVLHRGEEPAGDRGQPLVPALALGDEDPAFTEPQIRHP
jgi:hypothetical protein